jgi:hypothetical protein
MRTGTLKFTCNHFAYLRYGCGKGTGGKGQTNQRWTINAGGDGHIRQAALGQLCMTPCANANEDNAVWLRRRQQYLEQRRVALVSPASRQDEL